LIAQFVFKGYGDCGSCHHSPTGGGLPNRWGRESLDVAFDTGVGWGNQGVSYDPATPVELKADFGLDLRLLPLYIIQLMPHFAGSSAAPSSSRSGGGAISAELRLLRCM
jgi:hypothetical protein